MISLRYDIWIPVQDCNIDTDVDIIGVKRKREREIIK